MVKRKIRRTQSARQASLQGFVDQILRDNRYLEGVADANLRANVKINKAFVALINDVLEGRTDPESLKSLKKNLERIIAEVEEAMGWNRSIETDVGFKPGNTTIAGRGGVGRNPADITPGQQHEEPAGELRQVQGSDRGFVYTPHETRNIF